MSFSKFVLKSSFRKKSRVIYTLIGIGTPIFLILFFALSIQSYDNIQENIISSFDITIPSQVKVVDENSWQYEYQNLSEEWLNKIKADNRVEKVIGTYYTSWGINETESIGLIGFDSSDANFMKIDISSGRIFKDNEKEIVLSNRTAKQLNKTLGDDISIAENNYKVVGITAIKSSYYSYTSIKNVKEIDSSEKMNDPDHETLQNIYIKVKDGVNASQVTKDLKSELGNGNLTIEGPDEKEVAENNYRYSIDKIISELIPVAIGIILTLLCITKSVYERTREIGVLKAIGWKSRRIFVMIISETIILTIVSFIIASILVILITFYMNNMDPYLAMDLFTFLNTLSIKAFLQTFGIVLVMALVGAIFPAIKASRLSPSEAVREE
jgi:putative ABC transport system permease protein